MQLGFDPSTNVAQANFFPGPDQATYVAFGPEGVLRIFGYVADDDSKRVVDAIEGVDTDARDKPLEPVTITSIDIADA